MKIEITKTARGFDLINFEDSYKKVCSLQKSSLATEDAIWLGVDCERMHLTQKQVKQLLPFLKHFVKTGNLIKDDVLVTLTAEDNLPKDTASALVSMIKLAKKYLKEERKKEE